LDDLVEYLEDKKYVIDEIQDLRRKHGVIQIRIKFKGYAKPEWHNIADIFRDLPNDVEEFLDNNTFPPKILKQARKAITTKTKSP
jgi:hypothetical protein